MGVGIVARDIGMGVGVVDRDIGMGCGGGGEG